MTNIILQDLLNKYNRIKSDLNVEAVHELEELEGTYKDYGINLNEVDKTSLDEWCEVNDCLRFFISNADKYLESQQLHN